MFIDIVQYIVLQLYSLSVSPETRKQSIYKAKLTEYQQKYNFALSTLKRIKTAPLYRRI